MKTSEIRELSVADINQKLAATEKELFEARFKHSLHQLEDTSTLPKLRTRVARLKTVLAQKAKQA